MTAGDELHAQALRGGATFGLVVHRAWGEFSVTSDGRIVNQELGILAFLDIILREDAELLPVAGAGIGRAIRRHGRPGIGQPSGRGCPRRGGQNHARGQGWEPGKTRWSPLEITKSVPTNNAAQFVNHEVGGLDGQGVVVHMDHVAIFKGRAKGRAGSHTEKHTKNVLAFLVEVDGDGKVVSVGSEPVSAVRR